MFIKCLIIVDIMYAFFLVKNKQLYFSFTFNYVLYNVSNLQFILQMK